MTVFISIHLNQLVNNDCIETRGDAALYTLSIGHTSRSGSLVLNLDEGELEELGPIRYVNADLATAADGIITAVRFQQLPTPCWDLWCDACRTLQVPDSVCLEVLCRYSVIELIAVTF